jgi:hypothetical protein
LKEIHYALKDKRPTKVESKEIQLVSKEMVLRGDRAEFSVFFSPALVIRTCDVRIKIQVLELGQYYDQPSTCADFFAASSNACLGSLMPR